MDSFTLDKIEFDAVRGILSGFCSTSLGKATALRIGPSRNPQVIDHWLQQVTQMVRALRDVSLPPFGGLIDVTAQLGRTTPGAGATGGDFADIASSLEALGNIRTYLLGLPDEMPLLREMASGIGDFGRQLADIRAIVEPDGKVADSASPKLATLRGQIVELSEQIRGTIYGYLRQGEVAKLLQNITVQFHEDRYVLPVKVENRGRLPGVVHRASQTGATVFVEPAAVVELNNRLADLVDDERREVQRLLGELALMVHPHAADMLASLRMAAHVDVVCAKAQYAYQFDMTCPTVLERGAVLLTEARHPLLIERAWRQEQQGTPPEGRQKAVPIDVRLGDDFDVLVITGSNTGGKTVALKTVALLATMAQSGMHIPAQRGAQMPAFRDIFIDIGDEQSLQQSLSTFGAHIKRIKYILHKVDAGSLVLLDELGSGTDPDEGGAIGQAIIDELRRVGCLAMVSTHLSVLKAYAFTHERVDNASVEFDTATLSPTYRLRIGTPGESHAITVASKLGLPRRIVAASREHLAGQGKQFRRAIRATGQARQVAEEARSQAQAAAMAAQAQQEVYQSKLADLHQLQEEFNLWLARLPELRPGDEVMVPSLGRTGRLVRLELHRQIALVDADAMQVEVPLGELMPDLGQNAVREQIAQLRQQVLDQARAGEQAAAEARRIQHEYQQSLNQQRERARQFDTWLGAIARVRVGDEVPIALAPGRAKLVAMNLPGLRATVRTQDGEQEISIQDLFPQTGPFARLTASFNERAQREARRQAAAQQHQQAPPRQAPPRRQGQPAGGEQSAHGQQPPRQHRDQRPQQHPPGSPTARQQQRPPQPQHGRPQRHEQRPAEDELPDKPVTRRSPDSQAARANHELLLATKPGDSVYVVPFHKRATLIRLNPERDVAVVQSGIFEMEIPLADLEPIRPSPPQAPKKPRPPRQQPPAQPPAQQPAQGDQPALQDHQTASAADKPTPAEPAPQVENPTDTAPAQGA